MRRAGSGQKGRGQQPRQASCRHAPCEQQAGTGEKERHSAGKGGASAGELVMKMDRQRLESENGEDQLGDAAGREQLLQWPRPPENRSAPNLFAAFRPRQSLRRARANGTGRRPRASAAPIRRDHASRTVLCRRRNIGLSSRQHMPRSCQCRLPSPELCTGPITATGPSWSGRQRRHCAYRAPIIMAMLRQTGLRLSRSAIRQSGVSGVHDRRSGFAAPEAAGRQDHVS